MSAHLTTSDYFKLNTAMKLDHYAVAFPNYPWLAPFKPYAGWATLAGPRRNSRGTTLTMPQSTTARIHFVAPLCSMSSKRSSPTAIMVVAQFGLHESIGLNSELRSIFQFTRVPLWPNSDVYIDPSDGLSGEWRPVNFPF